LQSLDDFTPELSPKPTKGEDLCWTLHVDESSNVISCGADLCWTLHVDESSNVISCGAGVVLKSPDGILLEQSLKFDFKASNN